MNDFFIFLMFWAAGAVGIIYLAYLLASVLSEYIYRNLYKGKELGSTASISAELDRNI